MGKVIGIILLIGLFVVALKIAIIVLLLTGLIFRTKETVGLIVILATISFFSNHPAIGFAAIATLVIMGIVKLLKSDVAPKVITDDTAT